MALSKRTLAGVFLRPRRLSTAVSDIRTVGVVGLGLLGHGIAQSAAEGGYRVVGVDSKEGMVAGARANIAASLGKMAGRRVKKGEVSEAEASEAVERTLERISFGTSLASVADADLVIEAIVEDIDVKCAFFESLGGVVKESAIFASNTSSLSIEPMARASGRPDRFVGAHYFNPVQLMKLCEVVRTKDTSPEVVSAVRTFAETCGKTVVLCEDTPGFVVNRLLVPYLASAIALIERQDASIPDVDAAMQLGAGYPMGPICLCDYVGLDTTLNILKGWVRDYPDDPAFFIPQALQAKVDKGKLGRKSGEGFYVWADGVNSTKPTAVSGLED